MIRRLRRPPRTVPFLHLMPNLVTIIGLCAGLTSIRFTLAERWDVAAALIIFAAVIDGLDGLIARRLNAASSFGAELDSLSDFVNFGVAPGLLVYLFALSDLRGPGWVFVLVFIICCCLRLARFNVNRDAPHPGGRVSFVGVPTPAGAMLGLLPVFLTLAGLADARALPVLVAPYLGLVGLLMVSRLRTPSIKGTRVARERVGLVLVGAAFVMGVAFTDFWLLMVLACLAYGAILLHAAATAARTRRSESHGD